MKKICLLAFYLLTACGGETAQERAVADYKSCMDQTGQERMCSQILKTQDPSVNQAELK